jgi:hypothetical protein
MITFKDAARKALEYFSDIYGTQFGNVLVEEVEQSDGYWHITLGYDLPSVITQFGGKAPRGFKAFKIDADTGGVLSMKIREVERVG